MNRFHIVDYILFVLMLLISLGIGSFSAFYGKKQNTTSEYLMGNRKLKLGPVALSICVSMISANTLVGVPAEVYGFGFGYGGSGILMPVAGVVTAFTLVQVIYPLNIISIHQYLEMRFGSPTLKWYGAVIQIILQILYVGTVLYGPAISLEVSTGVPTWISLISVSAVGICYTTIGGMKAVIWTDTFQCIVMVAGNIALIIIGCVKVGGVSRVFELNKEWGRLDVSLSADPTERITVWSILCSSFVLEMAMLGANQPCMQRTFSVENIPKARWSAILGSVFMAIFTIMSTVVGLVIFAYYSYIGCDPVQSGDVSSGNQILPYFIMDVLGYPGLPGLLFSCLFSASLSSLSSSINSMSAVMWEDILAPYFSDWPESRKTLCNKVLTVIFGLCCLASSFVMLFVGGSLIAIAASVLGSVLGPLLGVFFLATLVPFSNWIGALTGGVISAVVNLWMLFGSVVYKTQVTRLPAPTFGCSAMVPENGTMIYGSEDTTITTIFHSTIISTTDLDHAAHSDGGFLRWLYSISFTWYPLIGVTLCVSIGALVSLLTGYTRFKDLDPSLVASYVYCASVSSPRQENIYKPIQIRDDNVNIYRDEDDKKTSVF